MIALHLSRCLHFFLHRLIASSPCPSIAAKPCAVTSHRNLSSHRTSGVSLHQAHSCTHSHTSMILPTYFCAHKGTGVLRTCFESTMPAEERQEATLRKFGDGVEQGRAWQGRRERGGIPSELCPPVHSSVGKIDRITAPVLDGIRPNSRSLRGNSQPQLSHPLPTEMKSQISGRSPERVF